MNVALKKNEKYRVKYMRTHKVLSLVLDKDKDADIIEWLGKQENRSEAVRSAIRSEIAYEDNRPMGEVLHDNNKPLRYANERWIITDDGRCICPDCGESSFRFKFCPHCGALNRPESEAGNE